MPDPVSAQEKGKWFRELLAVQDEIGIAHMQNCVGKTLRVLVDDTGKTGEGYLQGRTDSNLIAEFPGAPELMGQFVDVKITSALKWTLLGEIAE
jgi:tRNA-2-methylthio-N6-dimethylallyladenosine synthase